MSRSCEEDPAFDYLLMLLLETTAEPLTVLPTHRVVRALGAAGLATLDDGLLRLFDVVAADRTTLEAAFGAGLAEGGRGRFGLWTRAGGAILTARRREFAADDASTGSALAELDVTILGAALNRLVGIDSDAIAGGERVAYTKSVAEAIDWVNGRVDDADAAFLLEPTPVGSISAVASQGDVMPQKSTYFYPKALTGLVINPLEW
jgi:hypothetical protein